MEVSDLILKPNDRCVSFGRLVRIGEAVTFEPPLTRPAIAYAPGREPPPRPSGLALPITGIDMAQVLDRREKDGAIEGWATIDAIWNDDNLRAVAQRPERPHIDQHPGWTEPPCPPPDNGWPSGDAFMLPPELHRELDSDGLVLNMTLFHPKRAGPVLVIAASDPHDVTARLGTFASSRICVVQSRYTRDEISQVRQELRARFNEWRCFRSGQTSSADGQIRFEVAVVRVVPEFARWALNASEGLVKARAWLSPAQDGPILGDQGRA